MKFTVERIEINKRYDFWGNLIKEPIFVRMSDGKGGLEYHDFIDSAAATMHIINHFGFDVTNMFCKIKDQIDSNLKLVHEDLNITIYNPSVVA